LVIEPAGALAGRVLGRDEPDVAHELLGGLEAPEVARLDGEGECRQRLDATPAAQAGDCLSPWPLPRERVDLALELRDAGLD